MLEVLKNARKAIGMKQSLKVLENGDARIVFIARDAEEKITEDVKDLCLKNSVEVVYIDSMKQLGKACGIEVGASVACILK